MLRRRAAWLFAGTCLSGLAGQPAWGADIVIADGVIWTTTLGLGNGDSLTVQALGAISANSGPAVTASGSVTLNNSGSLTGTTVGIVTNNSLILTNTGTITGVTDGVQGGVVQGINSGTITGDRDAYSIFSGSITNSGTITGTRTGVFGRGGGGTLTVENTAAGTISGGVDASGALVMTNAGTINDGVHSRRTIDLVNTGTISGSYGIGASDGSVTNAGTINAGTSGIAIDFFHFSDTTPGMVTLESKSVINGLVLGKANSTADKLRLGGATDGVFGVGEIGATQKYQSFELFEKVGTSTWRLSGTGAQDWTVTQGALIGDSNSLQGSAITNNASLGFEQNFDGAYAGVIGGTGDFRKAGSGLLTLTGTHTYTGATGIDGGMLAVNGSIASSSGIAVNNGGTLGGTGTVAATTINAGGTLAPGNSIGTITVNNHLIFNSGGVYAVEVSPTDADRTNITGGPATASLAGTVHATFQPGNYIPRNYTILSAAGGLSSTTFDALSTANLPAGFAAGLSYTGNDVMLNLTLALAQLQGLNANQQAVADSIIRSFEINGGLPAAFGNLSASGLTQLSGEVATGAMTAGFQSTGQFLGTMLDPFVNRRESFGPALAYAAEPAQSRAVDAFAAAMPNRAAAASSFDARWSTWGTAYGGAGRADGNAIVGSASVDARTYGVAVGADRRVTADTMLGFALAGGGMSWGLVEGLGTGKSDAFQAGIYGSTRSGPAYVSAALAYAAHWASTDRTVNVSGIERLGADFHAHGYAARMESGYRLGAAFGITPYAATQIQGFRTPAYAERALSGGGSFALSYAAEKTIATRSELGARFDTASLLGNGATLLLRGRAAWAHDFNAGRRMWATFQALPDASFTVNGAAPSADAALLSAAAELRLANGWSVAGKLDGEFAGRSHAYAGSGTIRYSW